MFALPMAQQAKADWVQWKRERPCAWSLTERSLAPEPPLKAPDNGGAKQGKSFGAPFIQLWTDCKRIRHPLRPRIAHCVSIPFQRSTFPLFLFDHQKGPRPNPTPPKPTIHTSLPSSGFGFRKDGLCDNTNNRQRVYTQPANRFEVPLPTAAEIQRHTHVQTCSTNIAYCTFPVCASGV